MKSLYISPSSSYQYVDLDSIVTYFRNALIPKDSDKYWEYTAKSNCTIPEKQLVGIDEIKETANILLRNNNDGPSIALETGYVDQEKRTQLTYCIISYNGKKYEAQSNPTSDKNLLVWRNAITMCIEDAMNKWINDVV